MQSKNQHHFIPFLSLKCIYFQLFKHLFKSYIQKNFQKILTPAGALLWSCWGTHSISRPPAKLNGLRPLNCNLPLNQTLLASIKELNFAYNIKFDQYQLTGPQNYLRYMNEILPYWFQSIKVCNNLQTSFVLFLLHLLVSWEGLLC